MKLTQLKTFFKSYKCTDEKVRLDQCTVICNQKLFLKTHISALEANPQNKTMTPYYDRLKQFYKQVNK